jgi:hypothetical protein
MDKYSNYETMLRFECPTCGNPVHLDGRKCKDCIKDQFRDISNPAAEIPVDQKNCKSPCPMCGRMGFTGEVCGRCEN